MHFLNQKETWAFLLHLLKHSRPRASPPTLAGSSSIKSAWMWDKCKSKKVGALCPGAGTPLPLPLPWALCPPPLHRNTRPLSKWETRDNLPPWKAQAEKLLNPESPSNSGKLHGISHQQTSQNCHLTSGNQNRFLSYLKDPAVFVHLELIFLKLKWLNLIMWTSLCRL